MIPARDIFHPKKPRWLILLICLDCGSQKDQTWKGGRRSPIYRHQRDLSPEGDQTPKRRWVSTSENQNLILFVWNLGSKRWFTKMTTCIWYSSIASTTSRNTWGRLEDLCLPPPSRNSLTRFFRPLLTAMLTESCIETWSLRTYWLTKTTTWN